MIDVKAPRTAALMRLKAILRATMGACADKLSEEKRANRSTGAVTRALYIGKMDAFASALGLVTELGPQIEDEAWEIGLEHGREEPRKLGY